MIQEEWVKQCVSERRLLRQMPASWSESLRCEARRKVLEKLCTVDLQELGWGGNIAESAAGRNIENNVGTTQVPLGVAGPLKICGDLANGEYYVPLATTEGALVASINRGCKAIVISGGAVVESNREGSTRGPVFRVEGIKEGKRLADFIASEFLKLQKIAETTSSHLKLLSCSMAGAGKYRYLRLAFDTSEAMGMNMATIAATEISRFIERRVGIKCVAVTGNFCVDKKPAWQNIIKGRGISVRAEVALSSSVVKKVLKTTSERIYEVWLAKCMIGSGLAGSMGFNAQFANVTAAVFLATGQDMAHVIEAGLGMTTAEVISGPGKKGNGLYIGVYLPDLMVGVVGGGTNLPTQKAALGLLGLGEAKRDDSLRLAEIIGGTVLAGEISILASLAEGSLAEAHQRLGRGRKVVL